MVYVKSVLVGFAGALLAAFVWILIAFLLPVFGPMLIGRILNRGGVGAASLGSGSIALAALIGFVIAALWSFFRFRATS